MAVAGLVALIAVTSLAVARVNGWFVPPYLLLMAWILLGPRGGSRGAADSGASLPTADRLIPPPEPSARPDSTPTSAPERSKPRGRFGFRRRVDPAQAEPVPELSTPASPADPKEAQPSAVRGWFARRKQAVTLDDPEPTTEGSAEAPESPESSVESATLTTPPKTRRRRRKKVEPTPEPPTEVAWVRVGPNQFVRQETPLSPEPNPDLNASPDDSSVTDGSIPIESRSLDAPSLDPEPPPLPAAPDPSALTEAPPEEALEAQHADVPDPETLPEPEPAPLEALTLDKPHSPDTDTFDRLDEPDDPKPKGGDPESDSFHALDPQEDHSPQDTPDDDDAQAELSGQEIDDIPDDLDETDPEEDDDEDDDLPPDDDDPENDDLPPDDDPDEAIGDQWDSDEVDDDDEDQESPAVGAEDPNALGPDNLQDEEHWNDLDSETHLEHDDRPLDENESSDWSNANDEDDDWSDEDDEDRWGASAAELAESIVGDAYRSPEPPPPEPSPSTPPSAFIEPDQGGIVGYGQDLQSYLNDLINMSGGVGVTPAPTAPPPPMAPYRPAPPLVPEPSGPEFPTPREPEAASSESERTSASDDDDDAAGSTTPPDRREPDPEAIASVDRSDPEHRPPDDPHRIGHDLAPSNPDEAIGLPLLRPGTRLTIAPVEDQGASSELADDRNPHPQSCETSTSSHHDRPSCSRDPHLPRAPPDRTHDRIPIGSGTSSTPNDRRTCRFDRLGRDPTLNEAERPGRSPATLST